MKTLKFTINGEPFGKTNMQPMIIGGHARAFQPKKNADYMQRIITILEHLLSSEEDSILFEKNISLKVEIYAFYQIPKGHYKLYKKENKVRLDKQGEMMRLGLVRPNVKPDLDNISKIILDAITKFGRVWRDDSQVVEESIKKYYAEFPKVVVLVKEAQKK